MDNANDRHDWDNQSNTFQHPTSVNQSRSVFPEDYRSLTPEQRLPSRLAEILLPDLPDHRRMSDLARMRIIPSLYTDLDEIVGRSASQRLNLSRQLNHCGHLRSHPHTRSISVPASRNLPKVHFESPLDSDLVPSDVPTNTSTTNSPHLIGNIANTSVSHPETIQPQTGTETTSSPAPAVSKNDNSLFKDLTLLLKNSRPFRPSTSTATPPSVRPSHEQPYHAPTLDALNPRPQHPRQQSTSSSDITTTPLRLNRTSQQHHAAHRPSPAGSSISKSPSCPQSDSHHTDLPPQSFPDDSPSMPGVKTPIDPSKPLIDLDTELPPKPNQTKAPFAKFSPLPSPVISERPLLGSVISSHSSEYIPRRFRAPFRSAFHAAADAGRNSHCATPKPESTTNQIPADPELLASIQKLDDRLSTIDPVQAQPDPPAGLNTVPSVPPSAEPPPAASGKSPDNPCHSVALAAEPPIEPSPPTDAARSQSRAPASVKSTSPVLPSNHSERRSPPGTRSASRAPSIRTVVQPLTEAALRLHSSATQSARSRPATASGLAHPAAPPNAKGSPRPTDFTRSHWSPGHPKDEEISSLVDTITVHEAERAKKIRGMIRLIEEEEDAREREFEILGERVRGLQETRRAELAEDGSMFGGSPRASALAPPPCEGSVSHGAPAGSVGRPPAEEVAGPPTAEPADKPAESIRGSKAASILEEVVAMSVRAASVAASARAASLASSIRNGSRAASRRTEMVSISVKALSIAGTPKAGSPTGTVKAASVAGRTESVAGTVKAESVVSVKEPSAAAGEKTPSGAAGSLRGASKPPSVAGTGKQGSVAASIRTTMTAPGARAPSAVAGSKAPTAGAASVAASVRDLSVARSSHAPSGGPSPGAAESKAPSAKEGSRVGSMKAESVTAPSAKGESVAVPDAQEEPVGEPSAKGESAAAPSASIALAHSIVQSAKPESTKEPPVEDVAEPVVEGVGEPANEEGGEPAAEQGGAPAAEEGGGADGGAGDGGRATTEGENKENEGSLVGQVIGDKEPSVRQSASTSGNSASHPNIVPTAINLPGKWMRDGPAGFKFVLIPQT